MPKTHSGKVHMQGGTVRWLQMCGGELNGSNRERGKESEVAKYLILNVNVVLYIIHI